MDKLQIFKNEEFGQVRVVMQGNVPWFVGKDVARTLGYKDTSSRGLVLGNDFLRKFEKWGMKNNEAKQLYTS